MMDMLKGRTRPRARRDAGITLVEMMVVLVIIAVVAALVVPNVMGRPEQARIAAAHTDMRAIASALELYRLDNRAYPTTQQGLEALVTRPETRPVPPNWHTEGYLSQLPADPWGNPYRYTSPAPDGRFELVSLGANGQEGGEGADADIRYSEIRR
jgi:general secretion pathway protein G